MSGAAKIDAKYPQVRWNTSHSSSVAWGSTTQGHIIMPMACSISLGEVGHEAQQYDKNRIWFFSKF